MQTIIFPLNFEDTGIEVANLQDGLLFLVRQNWFDLSPEAQSQIKRQLIQEQQEQKFSKTTLELIKRFKEIKRINSQVEGVDKETAKALNETLKELGAFTDTEDNVFPEINNKLDEIATTTRRLDSIDNKLGQRSNTLTNKLDSIDNKLGNLNRDLNKIQFLGLSDRGTEVKILQNSLRKLDFDIPTNELRESIFGVGTRDALLKLQSKYDLKLTGVLDPKTKIVLEKAIARLKSKYRLEGRIISERGLPAAEVKLKIYHRGFGDREELLGEVTTDKQGFYALPYSLDRKKNINLEVRAINGRGKEISLSQVKRQANRNQILNLVVPNKFQTLPSEYERLTKDLRNQLGDLRKLASAKENSDRQDLSFLHQETGWDARLIALAAAAIKQATQTKIPKEALYAMFRLGLPRDKKQLALLDEKIVEKAIAKAQDSGIVKLTSREITKAKSAFQSFATKTRLQAIAPGTLSSVQDLLSKTELNEEEQKTFANLAFTYQGAELWQKAKDNNISDEKISNLQLQGKLAYLTVGNAELTANLQEQFQSTDRLQNLADDEFYKPETWEKRLKELADDDEDKLKNLIPPAYEGKEASDRLNAYAQDLARKVRLSYPTQVIRAEIEKKELPLSSDRSELKDNVSTFLSNAVLLDYELGKKPLEAFIRDNQEKLFQGIDPGQRKQTTQEVKRLQRLYQITPSNEALKVLMEEKIDSAQQIVAFPYDTFLASYGSKFSSIKEAKLIYRKAEQVNSISFNILTALKQFDSSPSLFATSPLSRVSESLRTANSSPTSDRENFRNELIKAYPTLENLFGSLDFCECEHCRSVLSPAAYFVDLLDFLDYKVDLPSDDANSDLLINQDINVWNETLADWKNSHDGAVYPFKTLDQQAKAIADWRNSNPNPDPNNGTPPTDEDILKKLSKTPYEVLIERRPDLPHLALTCENTQTALPYIDVVNEILEYFVANEGLTENSVNNTGSTSTEELLAEPQNVIIGAYEQLKKAKYPLNLPFDLWLENVRQFFDHFKTPLAHILDLLRSTDKLFPNTTNEAAYFRNAIWAESLGISPSEYDIFTNFNRSTWYELYGYSSDIDATRKSYDDYGQRTDLNSAKALSRKLGVTYKELVELIKTEFINPDLNNLVILQKLDIDIDYLVDYKNGELSTAEAEGFKDKLESFKEKFPNFDAKVWIDEAWDSGEFERILLLADPNAGCNFDETILRFVNENAADDFVFIKINLFVRLWRKLGWTIKEVDRVLKVFITGNLRPLTPENVGLAMKTALVYIAHLKEISDCLSIGKNGIIKLLTIWSDIFTTGENPLYSELFLRPSILKNAPVFDHPLGNYLANSNEKIIPDAGNKSDRLLTLQGALNLTSDEISLIFEANEQNLQDAPLTLANVSLLYRYGLLAKALKISVKELIALKKLSGLDPFTPLELGELTGIDKDYPFTQTLKFIEIAEKVKQSNFSIEDLDYLLRDNFDPVGKYKPDAQTAIALFKTISTEIRRIKAEHSIPSDSITLTDEMLQGKMALIFPTDTVERFMGMWTGTIEYDEASVQEFLQKNLSFLLDIGDLDLSPITAEPSETFLERKKAKKNEQKDKLIKELFPFLQQKLIRQFVIETLASNLNAEVSVVELLLTNTNLINILADSKQPLLDTFTNLGETGITATFPDASGKNETKLVSSADIKKETKSQSASLKGYFEVPEDGMYRFYIRLVTSPNAESELQLTHLQNPLIKRDNPELSESTELKAGVIYQFIWNVDNLGDGENDNAYLEIQGETLSKANLNQLILYPQDAVDQFRSNWTLLEKTLQLLQGFELNEREVSYFLNLPDESSDPNLNPSPINPTEIPELFDRFFSKLATYVEWREYFGEEIIELFEESDRLYPNELYPDATDVDKAKKDHLNYIYKKLADLTRRNLETIQAIGDYLGFSGQTSAIEVDDQWQVKNPDWFQDRGLGRLLNILQVLNQTGISLDALRQTSEIIDSSKTEEEEYYSIARELRNTVKAKYEQQAWLKIAQPIFDKLRQRQRDALVGYIMPRNGFERLEQLFEYFLIDPGMEPVVQTSRIQLAISSLQLFIQRCLLNLEPYVSPSVINSKHWQWMKRYRVWEANRKIFLYPENFLEPEWRDDQTHIFQELMGSLLQDDVSNDSAENAFFKYLKQLEELARLEMVTMYLEEKSDSEDNVLHVIGRTYNQPHKYFYRRYEHDMWTPWEPVTTEIKGDHIVAVVWQERLHLFWATFLEKAEASDENANNNDSLQDASFNEIIQASNQALQKKVEVQLNWSEYYQGKWTTHESAGFDNVIKKDVGNDFNKKDIFIHVWKQTIQNGNQYVYVILSGKYFDEPTFLWDLSPCFKIINKYSQSEIDKFVNLSLYVPYDYSSLELTFTLYKGNNSLNLDLVAYSNENITTNFSNLSILQSTGEYSLLLPSNTLSEKYSIYLIDRLESPLIDLLESPFFFQDNQNTFFVEPSLTEEPFTGYRGYIVGYLSQSSSNAIGIAYPTTAFYPELPYLEYLDDPERFDSISNFVLASREDWLTNPATVLELEDDSILIGASGGLNPVVQPALSNRVGRIEGASTNPQLGIDRRIVERDISLNVVDRRGLNPNLRRNFNGNIDSQ